MAEKDVPGPCPWINQRESEGLIIGSKSQTKN